MLPPPLGKIRNHKITNIKIRRTVVTQHTTFWNHKIGLSAPLSLLIDMKSSVTFVSSINSGHATVPDCTLHHVGLALQRYALQNYYVEVRIDVVPVSWLAVHLFSEGNFCEGCNAATPVQTACDTAQKPKHMSRPWHRILLYLVYCTKYLVPRARQRAAFRWWDKGTVKSPYCCTRYVFYVHLL